MLGNLCETDKTTVCDPSVRMGDKDGIMYGLLTDNASAYRAAMHSVLQKLENLEDEFHALYIHQPIRRMEHRLKSPESVINKLRRKKLPLSIDAVRENIRDIAGIRIICNTIHDVYHVTGIIQRNFHYNTIAAADYISAPKNNGYRSLHIILCVPVRISSFLEDVPVEVQLRTSGMDIWSEIEHELIYKRSNAHPGKETIEKLRACANKLNRIEKSLNLPGKTSSAQMLLTDGNHRI